MAPRGWGKAQSMLVALCLLIAMHLLDVVLFELCKAYTSLLFTLAQTVFLLIVLHNNAHPAQKHVC